MGYLNTLFTRLKGTPPTDCLLVRNVPDPTGKIADLPMRPDEVYIELFVETVRLKTQRRCAGRLHGMLYSGLTLARDGGRNAALATIAKPHHLTDLDTKTLDRAIMVERRLLGAVPWHGGTLKLELGLFSIKAASPLSPVLDYVTRVSDQAGISFVGGAQRFLPLITDALDLILGQSRDVAIELALDTDLTLSRSEVMALVAVSKDRITPADLRIDPTDHKLLWKGAPLEDAYCVISIRRTDRKADFGEIPELAEGYNHLRDALKTRRKRVSEEAKQALALAIYRSPDLIDRDKARLVALIEAEVKRAITGTGADTATTFGDLPLYADQ